MQEESISDLSARGGPLALGFAEPLESDFRHEAYLASIPIVRWGIVLGVVLYAVFGILDGYMLPESHRIARTIRFAVVTPALLAVLAFSFSDGFERVGTAVIVGTSLLLAAGILAMMYVSRPDELGFRYYYTGLMLVVIWVGTFAQLGFRAVTVTTAVILGAYVGVAVGPQGMIAGGMTNPSAPVFINNSFFLAGAAILATFSSYAFEASKRARFLQTRKIETLVNRIGTLFGQQVSEEVAQTLVENTGSAEGRLVDVSVMFLDIRDFTRLADSRTPEEVAVFQNVVFGSLIDIIRAHRGIINQMMGDGLMATFGAPTPSETHPTDAVKAGLEAVATIRALAEAGEIPVIRIGVGIHTGEVVAGNIGNEFRKQYSLTGTNVIIAARIEQLNKAYGSQMLISDAVRRRVASEQLDLEDLGEVSLKGIERPVRLFRAAEGTMGRDHRDVRERDGGEGG